MFSLTLKGQIVDEQFKMQKIRILKYWSDQQAHFPKGFDERILGALLERCDFSLERTKEALENYFTLRRIHRRYLSCTNEVFEPVHDICLVVPLPKVTANNERIIFCKIQKPQIEIFDADKCAGLVIRSLEYLMLNDQTTKLLIVLDCTNFSFDHVKQTPFSSIAAAIDLILRAYAYHFSGVIMFNAPTYMNIIMNLFQKIFPIDAFQRSKLIKNLDQLYEPPLDRSCFPKDYGGELPEIEYLLREWNKEFKRNFEDLNKSYYMVTDESKRIPSKYSGQLPGDENQGSYLQFQSTL